MKARDVIINLRANVRANRSSDESGVSLDDLDHHLDLLEAEVVANELENISSDSEHKLELWRQLLSAQFTGLMSSSRCFVFVVYTAFLLLWFNLRTQIDPFFATWSLLGFLVSILIYVLFEAMTQLNAGNILNNNAALFISKPGVFLKRKEDEAVKLETQKIRRISFWYISFLFSFTLVFVAMFLLFAGIYLSQLQ